MYLLGILKKFLTNQKTLHIMKRLAVKSQNEGATSHAETLHNMKRLFIRASREFFFVLLQVVLLLFFFFCTSTISLPWILLLVRPIRTMKEFQLRLYKYQVPSLPLPLESRILLPATQIHKVNLRYVF